MNSVDWYSPWELVRIRGKVYKIGEIEGSPLPKDILEAVVVMIQWGRPRFIPN